jgi:probable F420-dependent oxidoreductase
MKFDATILLDDLREVPKVVSTMEDIGFDGLWTYETSHDGFLPLAIVAERSKTLEMGTSIALAFTRSPMSLAYIAWDLATSSDGRFILGLGTQVKAHNVRRFSVEWGQPVARLRDVILSLRAIWHSWATGDKLRYRGEFFSFTLMSPFFTPPKRETAHVPIYIAGVNPGLCKLAGQLCDGFHVHPYHSVKYLEEVVRPAIQEGAEAEGRSIEDVKLSSSIFAVTGRDEKEMAQSREWAREQISFYASTPTYKPVMAHHGWGEVAEKLTGLAARGKWDEMPKLVTDEMLDTYAVMAPPDQLAGKVKARYEGLLDRLTYYMPFVPEEKDELWRMAVETFHS